MAHAESLCPVSTFKNCCAVHESFRLCGSSKRLFVECAPSIAQRVFAGRQTEIVAVKYALTTLAALSFGSLSFRISHLLGWNHFGERLFVFSGGLIATAFLCAPLWA